MTIEERARETLTQAFQKLRLEIAGQHDNPRRWSCSDLVTDLAPYVAQAIRSAELEAQVRDNISRALLDRLQRIGL